MNKWWISIKQLTICELGRIVVSNPRVPCLKCLFAIMASTYPPLQFGEYNDKKRRMDNY
jgi:hypothetical protein